MNNDDIENYLFLKDRGQESMHENEACMSAGQK